MVLIGAFISGCSERAGQNFSAERTTEGIEISEGEAKVLFYQIQPKSRDGKYERAGYVHPLYSLRGNILTEDFPADHLHHHGIFWSWHQVIHNGKPIADGWTSENISWEVVRSEPLEEETSITLSNEVLWKSVLNDHEETPIVREQSMIRVYLAEGNYRIIDFGIGLAAVTDSLKIGGSDDAKGYGGFSLRLKLPQDIRFLNSRDEFSAQELALPAGPWLDFSGSFDGVNLPESGVAVFSHPSNPGHPQSWIIRKEKSMQNPAFPGRMPVDLTREGLRFKYRILIHNEDLDLPEIEKLYREYADLPG